MSERRSVLLGAIQFWVDVVDRQVIFTQADGIYGCRTCFTLERRREVIDGHESNGTWELLSIEDTFERGVAVSRLEKAFAYCREEFGADWCDYKAELAK